MKLKITLFLSFFTCLFFSCSEQNEEKQKAQTFIDADYYEYKGLNFQKYMIHAMMMIPDETADIGSSTESEIIHIDNDFRWDLKIGEKFIIHIEDFGNSKNLVASKKVELKEKDWFEIKYLVDEKDLIVYQKILKVKGVNNASPKVGVDHISYHVYAEKVIDGITYELRNSDEGNDKELTRWIAKSIKSFKALKTKQ
jgi:hypothetical protein